MTATAQEQAAGGRKNQQTNIQKEDSQGPHASIGASDTPGGQLANFSRKYGVSLSLAEYLRAAWSSSDGFNSCWSSAAAASSMAMSRLSQPSCIEASALSGATWDLNFSLAQASVYTKGKAILSASVAFVARSNWLSYAYLAFSMVPMLGIGGNKP